MITGEFLVCDDLGPLGRLVPPGDLLVMEPPQTSPRDHQLLVAERAWITEQYNAADKKAAYYRRRLKTAHLSGKRDAIREWFDIWTIEAEKYAICDRWLLSVIGKLENGEQMAMNVPSDFSWDGYGPVRKLVKQVVGATDEEIIGGARFRAQ